MKRSALGLQVPVGTEDILPRNQAFSRTLEQGILGLFAAWAYQEVSTPTLEYGSAISPQPDKEDLLYKFFDREGRVLALRPELTTPIARMVGTRLRHEPVPLRLCYAADVFRLQKAPARREFRQAGVELLGSSSAVADAEIIALAVDTLKLVGVKDFQINLGHIEIFRGLIADLGLNRETCAVVEGCLARKDFVALELTLAKTKLTAEQISLVLSVPTFHGGEEVLARVEKLAQSQRTLAALANLRQVYQALGLFGVQAQVAIDLGVLRGFDYYTGIVFEGYAPDLGFPLCEGGRYDDLLGNFGYACPATGFAINLEHLVKVLELPEYEAAQVFVAGGDQASVINKAASLRQQGLRVQIALEAMTGPEAEAYAKARGIKRVEFV
ncbi:MAG: ATP phosphoribosyltransferase regulatory subunit [Peptococcaceae bacterium]|nr:ATP phosphoribosyltransferase regulatory subunit [Peptococcaceae bacterium]